MPPTLQDRELKKGSAELLILALLVDLMSSFPLPFDSQPPLYFS